MAGLYTHITRATGTILTAAIYNADHQNHIDNDIPAMMDDYSVNLAQMQAQVDPGELGTENLATSLAGEIERFRFALKELKGTTYWYESAVNLALISSANVFTQPQTITNNSAAITLTLNSNQGSGPLINLTNTRNPGTAADEIGEVRWVAKDSAGVDTVYGFIDASILDPTNASEDGQMRLVTMQAGANVVCQMWGLGTRIGTPTGGDKGVGTLNAQAGVYIAGHGTICQHDAVFNSNYTALGAILPQDDTIPQITEGDQVLSINITPTNAGSRIYLKAVINVGGTAGLVVTAAIFRVGFSDASNASSVLINAATTMEQVVVEASYQTGSVAAHTFTVRVGSATATDAKLNGDNTTRQFGGASVSRLDCFEILPQ